METASGTPAETYMLSAQKIKAEAQSLGFCACGLAQAGPVDTNHATFFAHWLQTGRHAGMAYMNRYTDKRTDPSLLVENAHTVVSVALNYYPPERISDEKPQLSWYAYGQDYHDLMRRKLHTLLERIQAEYAPGTVQGRCFCDTAPVLERYWAWRGGMGWMGKHTQLVIPQNGSAFFLGELILNLTADRYDRPMTMQCGTCRKCIEACPTGALTEGEGLDARRCLSYLTIENRGEIPAEAAAKMAPYFYGCDRCLRACPHLRHAVPTNEEGLKPRRELLDMTAEQWSHLTVEEYRALFKGSAVKRAKYEGLMRNLKAMNPPKEE